MVDTDFSHYALPNTPEVRRAFDTAMAEAMMLGLSNPALAAQGDDGYGVCSLKVRVRAGEILNEAVPNAPPQQVAGAVFFLTQQFSHPAMMRFDKTLMPDVYRWSEEWQHVQRNVLPLSQASLGLRQIIAAAAIARDEGMKKAGLTPIQDPIVNDLGDLQSPALSARLKQTPPTSTRIKPPGL